MSSYVRWAFTSQIRITTYIYLLQSYKVKLKLLYKFCIRPSKNITWAEKRPKSQKQLLWEKDSTSNKKDLETNLIKTKIKEEYLVTIICKSNTIAYNLYEYLQKDD